VDWLPPTLSQAGDGGPAWTGPNGSQRTLRLSSCTGRRTCG